MNVVVVDDGVLSLNQVLRCTHILNRAGEPLIVRHELDVRRALAHQPLPDIVHNLRQVIAQDLGREPGSDTLGPVHQDHRHNRHVVDGLDRKPVVIEVAEDAVVVRRVNLPRDRLELREDVPL